MDGAENKMAPTVYFKDMLRKGHFMIQRCTETGVGVFYPRVISMHSGKPSLEWIKASGNGTVYSTTVIHRKPERGGNYNLALIDLEEGCRIMSRVDGVQPEDVYIGMQVHANIVELGGEPAVTFRCAAELKSSKNVRSDQP
ncbi:Zn-ribbon domain-containing OB-fold protein [Pusillimonas sp. T7-7]|uniref:Zn-ribbon domain-containing OB-fold protein n=1 Tax=Pusillimonas sp. (strain T7-7) TaxID=1007105 RepID=UPI000674611F|nr:OB-fold domain-containing protein [Pusillimonas sp. T7-7]